MIKQVGNNYIAVFGGKIIHTSKLKGECVKALEQAKSKALKS
jgi:hypothetical protein